ncbi:hypothetical protein GOP47_0010318 [Adiantum capillus-veneris]|uniref:Uncharacterized protein n=1 Tax=Adiantum capillus-veneris TaxID=13818 RepID=A0A9D4UV17_ADICA|nr:hypothetical protein GOP47_0010318 [Adiantum capillus-veneris]
MAAVGRLEMLLNSLPLQRPLLQQRTPNKLKAMICCSISDTGGKGHTSKTANPKRTRQQIQDRINADLARKYPSDDEDNGGEDPLYIEEDDPNWLDEPDDGWGYKVSDIFKEDFGIKNRKKYNNDSDDDVNDIPEMDWDLQPETFAAVDVDAASWTSTVFGDPSPLVALIYERYGKKGRECYHVLRELEDAANRMWETKRLPPRLVKIHASFEEDLVGAIGIKEIPTLLFIKGQKLIHYQSAACYGIKQLSMQTKKLWASIHAT